MPKDKSKAVKPKSVEKAKDTKGKGKSGAIEAAAIDDIFAAPKSKAESSTASGELKKKKGKKLVEKDAEEGKKEKKVKKPTAEKEEKEESKVVEVVDPSAAMRAAVVKTKTESGSKRDKKAVEEDRLWRDSRGDGNRRRTEEGYFIFKEAELQIDPEAGGTPLCPFDCECCF